MTVYPFILHLGSFEITGYGLMMMVAFLMGGWPTGGRTARSTAVLRPLNEKSYRCGPSRSSSCSMGRGNR